MSTRQRHPLVELVILAGPTVASMTSYTLMQTLDKLMVSRIGPDPIYVGAQGNGGLAAWAPIATFMGLLTVINTYVSQNLGAGREREAPAYAWNGLWLSMGAWVLLIPYLLLLPTLFAAMGHEGQRLTLETRYAQILVGGAGLTLAARAVSQFFYGMHKPVVVLVAGLSGNLTNVVGNALFIYGPNAPASTGVEVIDSLLTFSASVAGALNIPALGVTGAAVATVLGTVIELIIPMAVFLSPKYHARCGTRSAWRPSFRHFRDVVKIGWPGAVMFGNEMVCWAFFMVYLVGGFGQHHSTAGWIAHQWMSISFMPAVGISVALTAMVGKCMGMKRPDLATQRVWMGLGVCLAYMGLCGVAFATLGKPMMLLFIQEDTPPEVSAQLVNLGSKFLLACAAFQLFDAVAMSISGALRGAGDTVWPGVVTVALSWTIIVAGGLAMARLAPHLESVGPWIAAAVYIAALGMALLARFLSGRWKTMKLVGDPESAPPGVGATDGI